MNNRAYNFFGNKIVEKCICGIELKNEHLYTCFMLRKQTFQIYPLFDLIYNGTIHEQKKILYILKENEDEYIKYKSNMPLDPMEPRLSV